MNKWNLWCYALFLATSAVSSSNLHTGLGMKINNRPKRPLSEAEDDRQMVTIDLSALRPSLPGLVLYKYGEVAPKLVQIDLSALNPQLQPHVIWPEFDQLEFMSDRSFDFDTLDAIPYLTDDESFITPKHHRMAMMAMPEETSWPDMGDITDSDIYDFIPDSRRNDELRSLQGSLPLADEVIVPLDWEETKTNQNSAKRNVFMSRGWKAGGQKETENLKEKNAVKSTPAKVKQDSFNVHYTPYGTTNWIAGKRKQDRETESEDDINKPNDVSAGKKNVFVSSGWGAGGQHGAMAGARRPGSNRSIDNKSQSQPARLSSQESWSIPRQYWSVPHLLGSNWQ